MRKFFLASFLLASFYTIGCGGPEIVDGQAVYHSTESEVASGPTYKQSELRVYTLYKPQKQRINFNGVFNLTEKSASIVWEFWQEKFHELTRVGYYDRFFVEFYDYMSYLANAYPNESLDKDRILFSLEKSFQFFCSSYKILDDLHDFKRRQESIYCR